MMGKYNLLGLETNIISVLTFEPVLNIHRFNLLAIQFKS